MPSIEKCEKKLLKVLISNVCSKGCFYCPFSKKRDYKREVYNPLKLAQFIKNYCEKSYCMGAFVSSGIIGKWDKSQERINETAYYLRKKMGFKGYLHLKIMPGAEEEAIKEAILLGDRVSINLEAPSFKRLKEIAPEKNFNREILNVLYKIRKLRFEIKEIYGLKNFLKSGVSTQFVVGARKESDYEYLKASYYLLKNNLVNTVYFSAFTPVRGTEFENLKPVSKLREKRLYQAFKLLKYYGFKLKDIIFDKKGNLNLNKDPKILWAERHKNFFPVNIKKADFYELLRVPGIGPKRAKLIIEKRKEISAYHPEKLLKILPLKSLKYIEINNSQIFINFL